ncbi:MAG: hypothetical protein HKN14_16420 [Marinicaulis sp.]|nr:hypothetical protein [Marinicaulis sp.]
MRILFFGIATALLAAAQASASDVVDQEQLMMTPTPTAIGGGSDQELAQSFTVGADGFMTQVRIPVACSSGELFVEIQTLNDDGEPSGTVVASARVAADELPPPGDNFETIFISPPLRVRPGDKFAIVLKNPAGSCAIRSGPEGDTYPGGQYFYDARPNPPGWVGGKDRPAPRGTPGDMPFQTVVDDGVGGGSSNMCFGDVGNGPIPLPFSDELPLCACLSDAGANEWRCRLLHPDFFIIRRIEFQPNAKDRFTENWAFTPLTELNGPVTISFKGDGMKTPIVHEFGKRSKPGSFEHLKIFRKLRKDGGPLGGEAEFNYPMKDAIVPAQKEFGFDAEIPGAAMLENMQDQK